ncbi:DUF5337 family protein [Jannaschia pohangensis]|uniref:Solute:sodium symporter small subunit n=1 Tax=Jannaschia pohangensis TaxID=390807 RepID=A0A1I3Q5M4_9RHOB|nr:DUF5337 family protein [Jannaschia pohangensis]SFJ28691.1 hypothetical protein SAMN04488095_2411 [Jannaschia pohangensis]
MTGPSDLDIEIAKRSGRVALLILGLFAGWGLLQFLGAQFDLSRRVMGLGDSIALVGMAYAIYETVMIWRLRQTKE